MKRALDLALVVLAFLLLVVPALIVALLVKLTSRGPVLYWSDRVGQYNQLFRMPKFRTMRIGTPTVATHLLTDPASYLTPIGSFLRRSSLDEIPQLICILTGSMGFVGPRPALSNQHDLVALRTEKGVDKLVPGLTGLAQISGRDSLTIPDKVEIDAEYARLRSIWFDIRILWVTLFKIVRFSDVSH